MSGNEEHYDSGPQSGIENSSFMSSIVCPATHESIIHFTSARRTSITSTRLNIARRRSQVSDFAFFDVRHGTFRRETLFSE
jgi:hypothetical protein